jgi:aspartate aminotransferase
VPDGGHEGHCDRISALIPLTPTAVNRILAEIRQVQSEGRTVISLMRGEPDFDTPAHIAHAAIAAIKAGRTR